MKVSADKNELDWTYILDGLSCQYLGYSSCDITSMGTSTSHFGSNFRWILSLAIVVTVISLPRSLAWTDCAIRLGGTLVFDLVEVSLTVTLWAYRFTRGKGGTRIETGRD